MARFVTNPQFLPELNRATSRALTDVLEEAADEARRAAQPASSRVAGAIKAEPVRITATGPSGIIRMGKGLGPIFEFSNQQQRRTRSGANRGVMRRYEFFNKTIRAVVSRGLDIRRYL